MLAYYERVTLQEQRLERDLALARTLQFRLLPGKFPSLANAELAARFNPAQAIGGDLYDFLQYPPSPAGSCPNCLGIAIGDVSGKGPAAALYAALVSGFLRSHATDRPGAAEMLFLINQSLAERRVEAQYVTLAYAIWKDEERNLQVANSGLPRPIYCKQGKSSASKRSVCRLDCLTLSSTSRLPSMPPPATCSSFSVMAWSMPPVPEGVLFGRGRIEKIVEQNWRLSADDLVKTLFQAIKDHAAGAEQFDDQTVVALKVKGSTKSRAQK